MTDKTTMVLFLLLFPILVFANDCEFQFQDKIVYLADIPDEKTCKEKTIEALFQSYKDGVACGKQWEVNWKFEGKKEKKVFECSQFSTFMEAESTMIATAVAKETLGVSYELGKAKLDCLEEPPSEVTNKVSFNVSSKDELKKIVSSLSPSYPGDIFDKIDDYSFQYSLENDNNRLLNNLTNSKGSNDKANTHAYSYVIQKRLGESGYTVEVAWRSQLYTTYTDPNNPDYRKDENKVTHVSQNFIEENLATIAIKKIKDGDKVFWSIGGGVHELNKDDIDRPLLFSGLQQQQRYHKWLINRQIENGTPKIITKYYDNVPQGGSDISAVIEGNIGKRETIDMLSGSRVRTFVELDTGARLTGVAGASSASASGSLNLDLKLPAGLATRGTVGMKKTIFSSGDTADEKFAEVTVGSKNVQVGYRFTQNSQKLASYQNPLPAEYGNRNEDAPKKNNIHMLFLRVGW